MRRYLYVAAFLGGSLSNAGEFGEETLTWASIGHRANNSVACVLSYGAVFSWMQPYKAPQTFSCSGTGFFIDGKTLFDEEKHRYLLTNYHVIADAKRVYITLSLFGKKRFEVSVEGVCPEWDLALLRLSEESREWIEALTGPIQPLELGDSDNLYSTQSVLAVGYPLGFGIKTTSGAIAGRDFWKQPFLHVTTPINPGNSGGPLFTKDGKVVGINTASFRNAQNYNYVIPSKDILTVLPELHSTKMVRRKSMGMIMNRTTDAHALLVGNPLPAGAYISYVFPDSAEYQAGLLQGDMLYEVIINECSFVVNEDGEVSVPWRKKEKISLAELLARCRTTDSFSLVVYRNGEKLLLSSSFVLPSLYPIRRMYPDYEQEEIDFEIVGGLVCMQLRSNHLEWLFSTYSQDRLLACLRGYVSERERNKQVLVVTQVFPGSQADFSQCFFEGSLLDKVNGDRVSTLQELRESLTKSRDSQVITISTKDELMSVFDLKKIIQDEYCLSYQFKYTITPGMEKLIGPSKEC